MSSNRPVSKFPLVRWLKDWCCPIFRQSWRNQVVLTHFKLPTSVSDGVGNYHPMDDLWWWTEGTWFSCSSQLLRSLWYDELWYLYGWPDRSGIGNRVLQIDFRNLLETIAPQNRHYYMISHSVTYTFQYLHKMTVGFRQRFKAGCFKMLRTTKSVSM